MMRGVGVVSRTTLAVLCATAGMVLGGCALHRAPEGDGQRTQAPAASGTLEEYIGKVRQLSSAVRPRQSTEGMTLERQDPELLAARALLAAEPTAEHHRLLGEIYARNGVLDAAYEQFKAALKMAPRDAAEPVPWLHPRVPLDDRSAARGAVTTPFSPAPEIPA